MGNGLDPANQMGPVANDRRLAAMETLVADATARGARVMAGGSRIGNRGYYFPLTVLADVPDEARAWERGVDELAQADAEVAEYVRTLEEAKDAMELPEASGDAIAREFERYFRRRGGTGEPSGPGN